MKILNRLLALMLVVSLIFVGCVKTDPDDNDDNDNGDTTTEPPATDLSGEPYYPGEIEFDPPTEVPFPGYSPTEHEMRDIPSLELITEFKTGWNLGNTFDAPAEKSWGNPETTYTMLNAVKEAGFDAIRVPVTWKYYVDTATYQVKEERMDRVEEVVQYVLALDMYCILNTHHEESWMSLDAEDTEKQAKVNERFISLWEQICERFEDYNEKLIFEGMNEPRTIDSDKEWEGGTAPERDEVNRLNQLFIDTVRASGGNNPLRHLMIPSYAASSDDDPVQSLYRAFPKEDDKVIVSIHAYIPNKFTQRPNGSAQWKVGTNDSNDIDWMFGRLKTYFLDRNIPVIIGETGAIDRGGNLDARVEWAKYFFDKSRDLGIPCFVWDNGSFYRGANSQHSFGLLHRNAAKFIFPEIIDSIMSKE
ncbi:MAG: glycoside hydrolase family 5 protein [Oscillospiraceae bacterium]|nr:glycoside hydrolase family 5 protein [Oscillospiraceae bacterium]